jgi:cation-transporting ATPase I
MLVHNLKTIAKLFRERSRRASAQEGRAYIEIGDIGVSDLPRLEARLRDRFASISGVQWYEVNPQIRRVVVAFDKNRVTLEQIFSAVTETQAGLGPRTDKPLDQERDLPDDSDLEVQRVLELAADILGLWAGLGLRLVPFVPTGLGINAVTLLSLIQNNPGLRRKLDERFGDDRADLLLNLAIAFSQAISERPLASAIGIAHKMKMLQELKARTNVWKQHGAALYREPSGQELDRLASMSRPRTMPKGPIEHHSDRVWMLAASGFAVSLLATRNLPSAMAAVLGSLPTTAKLGRELFADQIGQVLAERGALVLAPAVLRRLDRVDCLVIQSDLVSLAGFTLGETVTRSSLFTAEAEKRCRSLFDPSQPLKVQRSSGWSLGPPSLLGAASTTVIEELTKELEARIELLLALAKGDEIVALQEVKILARNEVEEVMFKAEETEMRVVVACDNRALASRFESYETIPGGPELVDEIRRLQRQGHMVCYVGTARSPGLQAADCSIGVLMPKQPTPWGAHIICGGLSDLRVVIGACANARKVSTQSVQLALGSAAISTLVSGGGILGSPARRVTFVANAATLLAMFNGVRRASVLRREPRAALRDPTPWHALETRAVLARLRSSRRGLSHEEALVRRTHVNTPAVSSLSKLGRAVRLELANPLTPLMATAAGLSALVGSTADAVMVASTGALSALIGAVQGMRAERAIRLLTEGARPTVRLLRDGVETARYADASELVVGDLISLGPGDEVPADCRILETKGLEVDASSLTGESLPVVKTARPCFQPHIADRESMLYAGMSIAAGRATAVVVATGEQTEAERAIVRKETARSNAGGVEERLRSLMHLTGPMAGLTGIGLIGAGLLRGKKLEELVDMGVSLTVAAVPEGLPLLATAAQIAAAQRLAERGAVVRNVRSIEALGRVDLICLDKTGTLTEGRLELQSVFDGVAEQPISALDEIGMSMVRAALRASTPLPTSGMDADPIDKALLRGAASTIPPPPSGKADLRISELPFESARGFHAAITRTAQGNLITLKGAPERILDRCSTWRLRGESNPLSRDARQRLTANIETFARAGLRAIAVAERALDKDHVSGALDRVDGLAFLGLLLFRDLVRPSAQKTVDELRRAGIRVAILTGDHAGTAQAIAEEIGLWAPGATLNGAELAGMSDDDLALRLRTTSVFARVTPAQKVRLVRAMQRAGHVVAMAGDGVNDAPAMRAADVGLAVGDRSTAIARGAADVVLADGPLDGIVDAIVEGRAMWVSVRDAVSILIGGNIGEIAFSAGVGLVLGQPPLTPRQLLLVNFFTDIAPATAIAIRPPSDSDRDLLANNVNSVSWDSVLNREIAWRALLTSFGAASGWFVGRLTGSRERANTIGLAALVYSQLGQTLTSGELSRPVLLTGLSSAAALATIIQMPGLSHLFGCHPLGPLGWATAIGASALATGASTVLPDTSERAFRQIARRLVPG